MFEYDEYVNEGMSGLDNLRTRLEYRGGVTAEGRFQKDKLESLRKALLYSYQAETAVIDGKMFRCLMNTNKQKADYDCKILSIPYEDICLGDYDEETAESMKKLPDGKTSHGKIPTGIKPGKTFLWKETNTHWITYLQYLEEDSYFRAEVYKCVEEPVDINGQKYYVHIRGPVETQIPWRQRTDTVWNDINYSLIMYITKDENTLDYFYRFQTVKIGNNTWRVSTVDSYNADGIIQICLSEWFNDEFEELRHQQIEEEQAVEDAVYEAIEPEKPHIIGSAFVHPYDKVEYEISGLENGEWSISNGKMAKFIEGDNGRVVIQIVNGTSGSFDLMYKTASDSVTLPIVIKSLF